MIDQTENTVIEYGKEGFFIIYENHYSCWRIWDKIVASKQKNSPKAV